MDITGRIIAVLPERSGVSQRNGSEWRVASYVLETQEQYPKKICFEVFGADRIQNFNIQAGEMMTVSFDVDAHEYNGRWFNTIRAFRVDRNMQAGAPVGMPNKAAPAAPFGAAPAAPAAPFGPAPAAPAPDVTPFGGEASDEDSQLPF